MTEIRPVGPATLEDFVRLPQRLHRRGTYNHTPASDRALLTGHHVLSGSLSTRGCVAYQHGQPVGRIGLTTYPGTPTGYVGFLEAPDGTRVAPALFDAVREAVPGQPLVGPMDASFWVRYRLKVAGFDEQPYLTEPLNPPHHVRLWERAGFAETDRYRSAIYHPAPPDLNLARHEARLRRFQAQGYRVGPPRPGWQRLLRDMYGLISELYADFPGFQPVPYAAFETLFDPLRLVTNLDLVTMAYRGEQAEGFLVCLPDYGTGLADPGWLRRAAALVRTRLRPQRYVLAYLCVRQPGLGAAVSYRFMRQMSQRQAVVVGALTHVGKASEGYANQHLRTRNEYLLLQG